MSILIKGMEMPCACVFCELYDGDNYWCNAAKKDVPYSPEDKRAKFCPLIPVPDHGRLIDADAIEKEVCGGCKHGEHKYENCIDCALANAPTIIPADPAEEGEG